jgi:3-dehydroquinate dehydratase/shikimate dehydrogenase
MICISIAQESRRLALVDMLNASRQCDLLEVRLDRFGKAPDLSELLTHKPRPVIMSCRRPEHGGHWDGTEEERLAILRQCIVSKVDYVEIELEVADQIRPFPPTKRVISYTNLSRTPPNLADIYAQAESKHPDVIKLTTLARTPEEAWPLVQIVAKQRVPTVVVGLGKPGVMLTILGKKIGAPWTYAALERGMETYPDQPTVYDLETIYHYRAIERGTRLLGVTGFSQAARARVAGLNTALAHLQLPVRCLPLGVGNVSVLGKVMETIKMPAVLADAEHRQAIRTLTTELDPAAEQAGTVDLLMRREERWRGCNTQIPAILAAVEEALSAQGGSSQPLQSRMFMLVGTGSLARALGRLIKEQGGALTVASRDRNAAQALARDLECRHVQYEAMYSTHHDVLIVCSKDRDGRGEKAEIHPGYLKSSMVVVDVTAGWDKSTLLQEAESRNCTVVTPRQLFLKQLALEVRQITGKEVPPEVLASAVPEEEKVPGTFF